jgi:hypothetical protein
VADSPAVMALFRGLGRRLGALLRKARLVAGERDRGRIPGQPFERREPKAPYDRSNGPILRSAIAGKRPR